MDWLRYNLGLFYSCSETMRGRQNPGVSQWHIWMVCYELSLATRPFLRRSHPSDFLVVAVLRHRFAVTLHEWCRNGCGCLCCFASLLFLVKVF